MWTFTLWGTTLSEAVDAARQGYEKGGGREWSELALRMMCAGVGEDWPAGFGNVHSSSVPHSLLRMVGWERASPNACKNRASLGRDKHHACGSRNVVQTSAPKELPKMYTWDTAYNPLLTAGTHFVSNSRSLSGGSPTHARSKFSTAARWRASELTIGSPGGVRGIFM